MQCNKVKNYLVSFIKDEMNDSLRKEIEEHLTSCRECTVEKKEIEEILEQSRVLQPIRAKENYWDKLQSKLTQRLVTHLSMSEYRKPFWVLDWKQVAAATVFVFVIVAATLLVEHSFFLPKSSQPAVNQGELAYTTEEEPVHLETMEAPEKKRMGEEKPEKEKVLIVVYRIADGGQAEVEWTFERNHLPGEKEGSEQRFFLSPWNI